MTGIVIAFFLGICAAALTVGFAVPVTLAGLGLFLVLFGTTRWTRLCLATLAGFLALLLSMAAYDSHRVVDMDHPVHLQGTVEDFPTQNNGQRRFRMRIKACHDCDQANPERVLLTWPQAPELIPGDHIVVQVRMRAPRGLLNPGSFDFESWAFAEDIHATGYVLSGQIDAPGGNGLDGLRWRVAALLNASSNSAGGFLAALTVGDRRGIRDQEWDILRATGTTHLLAISGLHVGLVAGFGGLLGYLLFQLLTRFLVPPPRPVLVMICALTLAWSYAAMAGFSLPTQRALAMLTVWAVAIALRRRTGGMLVLAIALMAVLLMNPRSVLTPGLWLSFTAVAALLWVLGPVRKGAWWRSQGIVFLALLPVMVASGVPVNPISPLINLMAIPWLGFVILPSLLLGVVMQLTVGLDPGLLLTLSGWSVDILINALSRVAEIAPQWQFARMGPLALFAAVTSVCLILMPSGLPGRLAGILALGAGLIGAGWASGEQPVRIHILDVGQGLAVLVRTAKHSLLYDTGPKGRHGWRAADSVIIPYLKAEGVDRLDLVIVSHGDSDHAGGVESFRDRFETLHWLGSRPDAGYPACRAGQRWRWDGVEFLIHHPTPGLPYLGNESSCVLEIRHGRSSFLLTGDIGDIIESRLARTLAPVDGLTMPHHGSASSSSDAMLAALGPGLAIASAGHGNRFEMPREEVLQRYTNRGFATASTANCGRVLLEMDPVDGLRWIEAARHSQARRWRPRVKCADRSQTRTPKTSIIPAFQDVGD
jgi:competence protein ComEC